LIAGNAVNDFDAEFAGGFRCEFFRQLGRRLFD